jgi:hypothetical protein
MGIQATLQAREAVLQCSIILDGKISVLWVTIYSLRLVSMLGIQEMSYEENPRSDNPEIKKSTNQIYISWIGWNSGFCDRDTSLSLLATIAAAQSVILYTDCASGG